MELDDFEKEYEEFIKQLKAGLEPTLTSEEVASKESDSVSDAISASETETSTSKEELTVMPIQNRINITKLVSKRIKQNYLESSAIEELKNEIKEKIKSEIDQIELRNKIKEEVKNEINEENKANLVSRKTKYKKKAAEIPTRFYWRDLN